MPKKRNKTSSTTTISLKWDDKEKLRRLAKPIKQTKNGTKYETDSQIFNRIINDYILNHPNEIGTVANSTYPLIAPLYLRDESQQG